MPPFPHLFPHYPLNLQRGRISLFVGNTLYLAALGYYTIICFLGYNGKNTSLPSLFHYPKRRIKKKN